MYERDVKGEMLRCTVIDKIWSFSVRGVYSRRNLFKKMGNFDNFQPRSMEIDDYGAIRLVPAVS